MFALMILFLARATPLYKFLSVVRCVSFFSRLLIGQKLKCHIVKEVIELDELEEGNISATAGKQDKD